MRRTLLPLLIIVVMMAMVGCEPKSSPTEVSSEVSAPLFSNKATKKKAVTKKKATKKKAKKKKAAKKKGTN